MKTVFAGTVSALVMGLATLSLSGCAEAAPHNAAGSSRTVKTTSKSVSVAELPDGITLVERVERGDDVSTIPYSKYVMDNGLTIILTKDHSDPLVHVDVTYKVGSSREEPGRSGFAHFFEHMMFQGSQHVGDKQHSKIISVLGGTMNGGTTQDSTKYYQTVPSNQLETVLWLEADRMGFLLPSVTQKKFENQRSTVKNERAENYDNAPYGLVNESVARAMFPSGHPYSWPTIGYVEDLNRVDVNDLKAFFKRWYGPNNAILTIGGDIDEGKTLNWIAKYFSAIPKGPAVAPLDKPLITLDENRYISLEDDVALAVVYIAYPTVYAVHEDEAPLDVLMTMMGRGRSSLLHKNLSADGHAARTEATHSCYELACSFDVLAMRSNGTDKTLGELYNDILDTFAEFEANGANQDDLDRLTMWIVSNKYYGLQSVSGKVDQLSFYEAMQGDANFVDQDIARYKAVTTDDVMRVYRKYIKDKPAVILSVLPKGSNLDPVAPDNWTPPKRALTRALDETVADAPIQDNFDRSVMPGPDGEITVTVPELWQKTMRNGLRVSGSVNAETPTTTLVLQMPGGQISDPKAYLGLSSLTAKILSGSTQDRSVAEIAQDLERLGSSISFSYDKTNNYVFVRSLTENLDETLDILKERLLRPGWDRKEYGHLRYGAFDEIKEEERDAGSVAGLALNRIVFGDNPIAYREQGTNRTIRNLSIDVAQAYFESYYRPKGSDLFAVSNLSEKKLLQKLKTLNDWQGTAAAKTPVGELPTLEGPKIYVVDVPGSVQSQIRIARHAPAFDAAGDYFKLNVMNFALGSEFNSRLNLNLREDKGWTYWAGSRLTGGKDYGVWSAMSGVRADVTVPALKEILGEITSYAENGLTDVDYDFTQKAMGQSKALKYEGPFDKITLMSDMITYNLPSDFTENQDQVLKSLSQDNLSALAKEFLDLDKMAILVVGDAQTFLPELRTLGYPIIPMSKSGDVLDLEQ